MNATHQERESKLHAPAGFSLARLPNRIGRYHAAPAEFRRLHTIYYDTPDARLARWGCSLRYRVGEGWTLKLPSLRGGKGRALARDEHTFEGKARPVPAAALDLARAYVRGADVVAVAELRTIRTKRAIRSGSDGDVLADIVDDDVRVVDGTHVETRFRQIEIERLNADDDRILDQLASVLQREGAGSPDPVPKNVHALGDSLAPEVTAPHLHASSSVADAFGAAFSHALCDLIRLDAVLRVKDDMDAVHEIRTAVRRLRSYLRSFRPILERAWSQALREQLAWMNRLLARVRNLDVLIANVEATAQRMEPAEAASTDRVLERLRAERSDAYERVRNGLRERRYDALLDALIEAARAPRFRPRAFQPARDFEAHIMRGVWKRVAKAKRTAGTPPSERDLHQIRIKVKHVRFAAESFIPVCGKSASKRAACAEALQDQLGEHHDWVGAMHRMRLFAGDAPAAYAAGALAERARRNAASCRRGWRKTFKALDRAR